MNWDVVHLNRDQLEIVYRILSVCHFQEMNGFADVLLQFLRITSMSFTKSQLTLQVRTPTGNKCPQDKWLDCLHDASQG